MSLVRIDEARLRKVKRSRWMGAPSRSSNYWQSLDEELTKLRAREHFLGLVVDHLTES